MRWLAPSLLLIASLGCFGDPLAAGGIEVVLVPTGTCNVEDLTLALRERLDGLRMVGTVVRSDDEVRVQLPHTDGGIPKDLWKNADLGLYEVDESYDARALVDLVTARDAGTLELAASRLLVDTDDGVLVVVSPAAVDGSAVVNAEVGSDDRGSPYVLVELSQEGGAVFEALTRRIVGRRLAIVVDGKVLSAPMVREPIPGGKISIQMGMAGNALADAGSLASSLRMGALPCAVEVASTQVFGPAASLEQ